METEMNVKKISELSPKESLEEIGRDLYGEDFSIDDPDTLKIYKEVYGAFASYAVERKKSKGVLIFGPIGVGKSTMMRIYQRLMFNTESSFKIVTATKLKNLSFDLKPNEILDMYGSRLTSDLLIDDIGITPEVESYRNVINIVQDIIMDRYQSFVTDGRKTHFITNVIPYLKKTPENIGVETIETMYHKRCWDRLHQMCGMYAMAGKTKRY